MEKNDRSDASLRDKSVRRLKTLKLSDIKRLAREASHVRLSPLHWLLIVLVAAAARHGALFRAAPGPSVPVYPVVEVAPVQTEDINIYGEYVGRIRAQQIVEIRARVEGYLEKMLFAEGTYVKRTRPSSS